MTDHTTRRYDDGEVLSGIQRRTVIEQLLSWLTHYNEVRSHTAPGYRSLREYIMQTREAPSGI